jgi:hypothetical protein
MDESTRHEQRSRARRNGQSASRLYVGSENGSAGVEVTRMNRRGVAVMKTSSVLLGLPHKQNQTANNEYYRKLFFSLTPKGTLRPLASSPPGGGWTARRDPHANTHVLSEAELSALRPQAVTRVARPNFKARSLRASGGASFKSNVAVERQRQSMRADVELPSMLELA